MSKRINPALMGRKGERSPACLELPDDLLLETEDSHLFSDDEDPLPKRLKGDDNQELVTVPSVQTWPPPSELVVSPPPEILGASSQSIEGSSVASRDDSTKPKVASTVRTVRATDSICQDTVIFHFEKEMRCPVPECGDTTFKHASNYWRHWLAVHRASRRTFTCVPCGDDPRVDRTGRHGMAAQFRDKTALLNHFHLVHHCVDLTNLSLTENWYHTTFPTSNNSINPAPYLFGRKIDETKELDRLSDLDQEEAASQVRRHALALTLRCPERRGTLNKEQQVEWELMESIHEGACAVAALQREPSMSGSGFQPSIDSVPIPYEENSSYVAPAPVETLASLPPDSGYVAPAPLEDLVPVPPVLVVDAVERMEPPAAPAPVSVDPFMEFGMMQSSVGEIVEAVGTLQSLISVHASRLARTSDPFEVITGLKAQLIEERKQRDTAEAEIVALRTELRDQHKELEVLQQEVSRQRGELEGRSSCDEALKRFRIKKGQAEAAREIAEAEAAHNRHLLQMARTQVAALQKELLSGGVTPATWENEP